MSRSTAIVRSMKFIAVVTALCLGIAAPLLAQAPAPADSGWNGPHALELIERAQMRRSGAIAADTGLVDYQAEARVFVYFYIDRTDTGQRNLVKTDQLALQLFWHAPDEVQQRIVGWRDEKSLPTNIHYHLDHLTVVMENFADVIRIGDGDEVRDVLHPAAPGAANFYDYRLADSLTLRLPGAPEPVRVYEVQVRPKDPSRPGFVGSIFVDRRAGDIVRMNFTFTSAAYVDPSLDYIDLSLDNGLWQGRYWLPNEQRVEIRRRIPELDIPAGSVIRATMRVSDYRFNQPLPPGTFVGPRVVAVPQKQREAFPFEEGIHAEVREEGIGPSVELADVQRMARELVRERALQKVSGLRLGMPSASDLLRYDRAEGLTVAPVVSIVPKPAVRLRGQAGWAFGAEHALGSLSLETGRTATRFRASAYANRPHDIGGFPVISGAMNTLSSLLAGSDYSDLYYGSGGLLSVDRRLSPTWSLGGALRAERQRSATMGSSFSLLGDMRPVRPIDEGDLYSASMELRRTAPAEVARWWSGGLRAEYAVLDPRTPTGCGTTIEGEPVPCPDRATRGFFEPEVDLTVGRRWAPREATLTVAGRAGAVLGDAPTQALFPFGGRGTVPGYGFRGFAGERFVTLSATASAYLWRPWVRGRLLGAIGRVGRDDSDLTCPANASCPPALGGSGWKPSLGIGVGLVNDILRVDLSRGLAADGRWEVVVDANPSFWDFL